MGSVRIAAPATAAVTLVDAQRQTRSSSAEDNAVLEDAIAAATEHVEADTWRRFITQGWRQTFDAWPSVAMRLRFPPLVSVQSVKYVDPNGVLQTLDSSVYLVRTMETPGEIRLKRGQSWPAIADEPDAVRVEFTCGYGDITAVPPAARRAILMLVGTMFAHRESVITGTIVAELPHGYELLVGPLRVRRL
jgi:uncharacterized phiE125 gp8 family phage protein